MNSIKVLDCTLRDGGYCNNCRFGYANIKYIINGLMDANVDIVECGFLTNRYSYDKDTTRFTDINQLTDVLPTNRLGKKFVVLMNYGEYAIEDIPYNNGLAVDGIRVAFHKKDCEDALNLCIELKRKGYDVFIQDMVSLSYTDDEYIDLIKKVNAIQPYAFYIVDSFGQIKQKDLLRLIYLVDHNLDDSIKIGFHSHNNMQLAYSNAQVLTNFHTRKELVIDSSIYGMGRGAGNLNTELFVQYLNDVYAYSYSISPLLNIIDRIINNFYLKNSWGYSLPNYLAACHGVHPNYAGYFDDKKTLTVENINCIFELMDERKKIEFDKVYAEELYLTFMGKETMIDTDKNKMKFLRKIENKDILLIAPGKSSSEEKEKVIQIASCQNVVTISINFDYEYFNTDYIFFSNIRRYREIVNVDRSRIIVTSNILDNGVFLKLKYNELLNSTDSVVDNAGLMAIKFLMKCGVKRLFIAGFDGYSYDEEDNYANSELIVHSKRVVLDAMNVGIKKVLDEFGENIDIEFVTMPQKVKL